MATTIKPSEVRKAVKDARSYMTQALIALDRKDTSRAYVMLEKAQMAAFDAKSLIVNGGNYEPDKE